MMPTADGAELDEPRRAPHSAVKRFAAGFGKDRGVARRGKGDSSTDDGKENSKRAPKPAEDESLPKSSGGIAVEDEREGRVEGKSRTTRKPRRAFADAARVPFSRTVFGVPRLNLGRLVGTLSTVTRVRMKRDSFCPPAGGEGGAVRGVEGAGGELVMFSVPSRDRAKVVAILESLCYNYTIIKEEGVILTPLRALGRAGVVAGICVSAVLLGLYPNFVLEVDYVGDVSDEVRQAVADSGVRQWAFLPAFDSDALEEKLFLLDGVSYASVDKLGTRVRVEVRAEREGEHFVGVGGDALTATRRATVTRVIVYSGTALVGYGDVVEAGETLIAPYVVSGEDEIPCPASGEVFGMTYREKRLFFPDTVMKREYGESRTVTRLSFFGRNPETPKSPYEDYVLEVSVSRNGFLIGYTVFTYTFTEVRVREERETRGAEELERLVLSSVVEELPVGAVPLTVRTGSERGEGGLVVSAVVGVEERID